MIELARVDRNKRIMIEQQTESSLEEEESEKSEGSEIPDTEEYNEKEIE